MSRASGGELNGEVHDERVLSLSFIEMNAVPSSERRMPRRASLRVSLAERCASFPSLHTSLHLGTEDGVFFGSVPRGEEGALTKYIDTLLVRQAHRAK